MWKEFRAFISRGNVLDLAVAVIIGAAFTGIVNSLVNDIVMPLIGIIIGGIDFTALSVTVGNANVMYGNFIQAVINFLLIAFVVFLAVKSITGAERRLMAPHEEKEATPPPLTLEEKLLTEIRDLLELNSA